MNLPDSGSALTNTPLHQLQPLERFSERADDYARYRPSYPEAALNALWADLDPLLQAADIGAGTGIGSRLLADRGVRVVAIEPNAAMRSAAAPHPAVVFQDGTAEKTGLDIVFDLVTCFQAFHWFDPSACLPEFGRILRPGGRLALIWNDRDDRDPFTSAYSQFIGTASANHPAATRDLGSVATLELLEASPDFCHARQLVYTGGQSLDFDQLLGRVRSSSYIPLDSQSQGHILGELEHLYKAWADTTGRVSLRYQTRVYLAERV